jgi:hypothetical protein
MDKPTPAQVEIATRFKGGETVGEIARTIPTRFGISESWRAEVVESAIRAVMLWESKP